MVISSYAWPGMTMRSKRLNEAEVWCLSMAICRLPCDVSQLN